MFGDRGPCPCTVELFYAGKDENNVSLMFWQGASYRRTDVLNEWRTDESYRTKLLKGKNGLCALVGRRSAVADTAAVHIPYGMDMDSLYAYSAPLDCMGEYLVDTVSFHKQFATLVVKLRNVPPDGNPFRMRLFALVCGIDIPQLKPLPGEFMCELQPYADSLASCRLPRQNGGPMELHVLDGDKDEPLDIIDLAPLVYASGYDWSTADLKDIMLELDYARLEPSVSVQIWEDIPLGDIEY